MMFISPQDYLKRITYALEHMVAPQIDSDQARGQLLAAVFLLDQFSDRVEYKQALIKQEIESDCETIRKIVSVCEAKANEVPQDIVVFMEKIEKGAPQPDIKFRDQCDKMLSLAIEYFWACCDKLDAEQVHEAKGLIIKQIMKIGGRNLGLFKPSTSGKLIQTKNKT